MKKSLIPIIVAVVVVIGIFAVGKINLSPKSSAGGVNNVSVVDGKQIIMINAKGGYQPSNSIAKAGIPTVIRFKTNGTFDCSSSIRIPGINISKILPQTGSTDIDIGTPQVTTLQGTCGMGMYPFAITFQE